ncbi:ABC transporter permease [Candidatus Corynebacterium faecigallinarum]|uniref:ABC transporter permease n=1 Tax=Candidatus Corynebacterium faecigallinarum TaxID=2838528 RepID=UPI003FCFE46B
MSDPSEPTQPAGDRTSDAAADAAPDTAPDPAADNASDTTGEAAAVATDDAAAGSASDSASDKASPSIGGKLTAIVLGLTAAVTLMLFAFLTPQYNSGAENLPLSISGPDEAVSQITEMLDQQQPGAFEFTTVEDEAAAEAAVADRDSVGAIALSDQGAMFYAASGAGQPYVQMLSGIAQGLQAQGLPVDMQDVAPTTDYDPAASGLTGLALPLAFGGVISAAALSIVFKKRYGVRIIGSLAFSALAGLAIGAMLQFGYGTVDANYWATSGVLALGIAATSLFVIGLQALFGYAGLGIGALITILIANPLSGLTAGPDWLPSPWGTIGQFLPIGAAGDATRSVAFFDGAAILQPILVMLGWVVLGIALIGVAAARGRRTVAEDATDSQDAEGSEGSEGSESSEAAWSAENSEPAGAAASAEGADNTEVAASAMASESAESTESTGDTGDTGDTKA